MTSMKEEHSSEFITSGEFNTSIEEQVKKIRTIVIPEVLKELIDLPESKQRQNNIDRFRLGLKRFDQELYSEAKAFFDVVIVDEDNKYANDLLKELNEEIKHLLLLEKQNTRLRIDDSLKED